MGAFIDALANYNPSGFVLGNQRQQAALEQQRAATAATQQETAGLKLNQQIQQQGLNDQRVIRDAYTNTTGDPKEVADYLRKNGISGKGYMDWQQHAYDMSIKAQQLNNEQRTALEATHKQASDILDAVGALPADQQAGAYAQSLPRLQELAPDVQWKDPTQITGDDLKFYNGKLGHIGVLLERNKTQGEIAKDQAAKAASEAAAKKSAADAASAEAELPGKKAEAAMQQRRLAAMEAAAGQPSANKYDFIDSQINPQTHPDLNKGARAAYDSMLAAGANPEDAVKAIAPFATHAAQRDTEADPRILAARRQSAIIEAKALRSGDNPALADVPPAAASQAVNQATKLDTDYIKAREAVESMGKLLDLADQSNVAAGANIPMMGVGAVNAVNGIRRINSAEIAQYGSAGSLMQKIQGKLQGWTEGQPIPASVRDDIRELHQQLGESAYRSYVSGLDSLNKRTGAKFGPTQEPPNIRKGGAGAAPIVQHSPSTGQYRYSTDGGKTWQAGQPPK